MPVACCTEQALPAALPPRGQKGRCGRGLGAQGEDKSLRAWDVGLGRADPPGRVRTEDGNRIPMGDEDKRGSPVLQVSGSRWRRLRPFSEVGVDLLFPVDGASSGQRRGPHGVALTPLLPSKFNLLRTLPTPTRHVEEEGMASGLPTAWFRVSRGLFEFLSVPLGLGVGVAVR